MESGKDFLSDIFYYLPPRIRAFFLKLPPNICDEITEIRLRADKPVSIVTRNGCAFITSGGRMSFICSEVKFRIWLPKCADIPCTATKATL